MGTYEILKPDEFFRDFPRLDKRIEPSSRATRIYNCIAHAVDVSNRWWWPPSPHSKDTSWPPGCPQEATVAAFERAFATQAYIPCQSGELEDGYEKIALYADAEGPTHAAKQLPDGGWTSKCGQNVDIEHALEELEGPCYGTVVMFFRRPRQVPEPPGT